MEGAGAAEILVHWTNCIHVELRRYFRTAETSRLLRGTGMASFPALKLTYFPIRARAEIARLAFYIGGVPFEDERVTREQWLALKPNTPCGQLPLLTVNNSQVIAQSFGIIRYAGTLGGLYPSTDPLNAALVDQVVFFIEDIFLKLQPTIREADPAKKIADRCVIAKDIWPPMFELLEKMIEKYGGKWAVGDAITVADLAVYNFFINIKIGLWDGIPKDLVDKYPRIEAVYNAVIEHPKVVEWNEAHKK